MVHEPYIVHVHFGALSLSLAFLALKPHPGFSRSTCPYRTPSPTAAGVLQNRVVTS